MPLPAALQVLAEPIPLPIVQRAAQLALDRILHRHPKLIGRLGAHANRSVCFGPTDLPFEFVIRPSAKRVAAFPRGRSLRHDAKVAGPFFLLLALAEGRLDGDAEFFGRQLSIEGDMEAVLALRNAMENESLDFVSDLAPSNRFLRTAVKALLGRIREAALKNGGR